MSLHEQFTRGVQFELSCHGLNFNLRKFDDMIDNAKNYDSLYY